MLDVSFGPQFEYRIDETMTYGGALETTYHINKFSLNLRGSYLVNTLSNNSFAMGFGMAYKLSGFDVDFSAAYAPAYVAGNSMYVSLSLSYNIPREKLDPMPQSLEEYWLEDEKEDEKEEDK